MIIVYEKIIIQEMLFISQINRLMMPITNKLLVLLTANNLIIFYFNFFILNGMSLLKPICKCIKKLIFCKCNTDIIHLTILDVLLIIEVFPINKNIFF